PAGELDHQAQGGVDQALLRGEGAAPDRLRQLDLLRGRQQGVAARRVAEELEAVRGRLRARVIVRAPGVARGLGCLFVLAAPSGLGALACSASRRRHLTPLGSSSYFRKYSEPLFAAQAPLTHGSRTAPARRA